MYFRLFDGISIHALHEESDRDAVFDADIQAISIHALHEESDQCHSGLHLVVGISIHALHEESDFVTPRFLANFDVFQSTLSMRRATDDTDDSEDTKHDFNPRSP